MTALVVPADLHEEIMVPAPRQWLVTNLGYAYLGSHTTCQPLPVVVASDISTPRCWRLTPAGRAHIAGER